MKFYIGEEDECTRIDSYLAEELEEYSRTFIAKQLKNGSILVNQKKVKANYIVKVGDQIQINIVKESKELLPENKEIQIIYEDEDIVILNKEKNTIVHPTNTIRTNTLVNYLLYHIDQLSTLNGEERPGIVHRLDKDTTGAMIIAKNDFSHKILAEDFQKRRIQKKYTAIVHGNMEEAGIIDQPLARSKRNRKLFTVDTNGKNARTEYQIWDHNDKFSLLDIDLKTGRTHQIRVHMRSINHPILGDKDYGYTKETVNAGSQALHSYQLKFRHPRTREELQFIVKPQNEFYELVEKCQLKLPELLKKSTI